jgi:hypothetical protein
MVDAETLRERGMPSVATEAIEAMSLDEFEAFLDRIEAEQQAYRIKRGEGRDLVIMPIKMLADMVLPDELHPWASMVAAAKAQHGGATADPALP